MTSRKGQNRAGLFEDLVDTTPKEFDPEADDRLDEPSEDSSDDDGDVDAEDAAEGGREHYVAVSKSRLRKPKNVALGPQYRGERIGRDAVIDEEDKDDPLDRWMEDGNDSDDGVLLNGVETSSGDSEDKELADDTSDTDLSDEADGMAQPRNSDPKHQLSEIRKAMREEQKQVASSLSQATKADAGKGRAVKKQRTAFDALLRTRIKLQKSLIGANTIVGFLDAEFESQQREQAGDAITAAENAAFTLWSTINDLRDDLLAKKTGQKRKRNSFTITTPSEDLWAHIQTQEVVSRPLRNSVLMKWSDKARGAMVIPQSSRLNNTERQATVIDVLQEHLQAPDRLLKRAHTPRSCAPLQLEARVSEDPKIYDDADFYGLLLKELLEQRSNDSIVATASNIDLAFSLQREARTKKRNNVDTKASKGRKLRYTVHEKLQNFMAPENRCLWGEKKTDELFGSLLGQQIRLGEEGEQEEMDEGAFEEAGLLMFRN